MNSQQSQASTRLIARVLGPYMVVAMVLYVTTMDMRALLSGMHSNPAVLWALGAMHLLGGFVVLGLLQEWRSPAAIIIGVFGAIAVLEGLVLAAFPGWYFSAADSTPITVIGALSGLLALYLTYVGWRPVSGGSTA